MQFPFCHSEAGSIPVCLLLFHLTLSWFDIKTMQKTLHHAPCGCGCVCECACVSVGFDSPPPLHCSSVLPLLLLSCPPPRPSAPVACVPVPCSCSCSLLPVSFAFFDSVLKIHLAAIRRQLLCLDATFIKCFMVLNIKLYMDK